ncbi:uncharacterized protein LOC113515492 [Galleria mellonella]|uniref:Uncharacterized protein LOC113515492 n=1 Tax=Galleria mellonella TaxID=7137 RepID=A0A6J1WL13_GALME|nr:uncharacterized protein LOC113515492 [Galleria mellonella]
MSRWCRWTELDTSNLVELYKSFPLLWDARHKHYKDPTARKMAYEKILEFLKNPNLSITDIKIKIKNLRSSYYNELRKIDKCQASGQFYTSSQVTRSWFSKFKEIMEQVQKNEEEGVDESESEEEAVDSIDESIADNDGDAYVVSIKQEYLDELENQNLKEMASVSEGYMPAPKKFKSTPIYKKTVNEIKTDEFQLFANNMAEQLRALPLTKALQIQVELQTLVAKERINLYRIKQENTTEQTE